MFSESGGNGAEGESACRELPVAPWSTRRGMRWASAIKYEHLGGRSPRTRRQGRRLSGLASPGTCRVGCAGEGRVTCRVVMATPLFPQSTKRRAVGAPRSLGPADGPSVCTPEPGKVEQVRRPCRHHTEERECRACARGGAGTNARARHSVRARAAGAFRLVAIAIGYLSWYLRSLARLLWQSRGLQSRARFFLRATRDTEGCAH